MTHVVFVTESPTEDIEDFVTITTDDTIGLPLRPSEISPLLFHGLHMRVGGLRMLDGVKEGESLQSI